MQQQQQTEQQTQQQQMQQQQMQQIGDCLCLSPTTIIGETCTTCYQIAK